MYYRIADKEKKGEIMKFLTERNDSDENGDETLKMTKTLDK